MDLARNIFKKIVFGFGILYGLNIILSGINIILPINIFSIGLSICLGIPGVLSIVALLFVLK